MKYREKSSDKLESRGAQLNKTEQKASDLNNKAEIFGGNARALRELSEKQNKAHTFSVYNRISKWFSKGKSTQEVGEVKAVSPKGEKKPGIAREITKETKDPSLQGKASYVRGVIGAKVKKELGKLPDLNDCEKDAENIASERKMFSKSAASSARQKAAHESTPKSVVGKIMAAASRAVASLLKFLHLDGMFGGKKDMANSDSGLLSKAGKDKEVSNNLKNDRRIMGCLRMVGKTNTAPGKTNTAPGKN